MSEEEQVIFEEQNLGVKQNKKRKILIVFTIIVLASCGLCSAIGIFNFNLDLYGGAFSIESLVLTGGLSETGEPMTLSRDTYLGNEKITGLVTTSGADFVVGMRWYYGDEVIYEQFGRPVDNKFATYIEGSPASPLHAGSYKVEAIEGSPASPLHAGSYKVEAFVGDGEPIKTVTFVVEEYDLVLDVSPPQPTPIGHKDIENAPYVEVPFAFDEVWEINGEEWNINEVKITFFKDDIFFITVVESEEDINELNELEAREISKPIAIYATENGYYEMAKSIAINGETYNFDELTNSIVVTLYNKGYSGGYRTPFDFQDLSED